MADHATMSSVPSAWVKSELAWYDLPPRQSGIQAKEIINLRPVGNLSTTPYTFEIIPRGGQYIDISATELYVKAKMTRLDNDVVISEATANKAGNKASLVTLGLHSLWQEVEVDMNSLSISDNVRLYPYRSFLETALNATSDMAERLGSELFYPDDIGDGEDGEDPSSEDNAGAYTRYSITGRGNSFEMRGRLHGDIFNCRRLIPDAVPLRIKLHPSTDKFRINSATAQVDDNDADATKYKEKIVIEDIYLRVVYITPTADVYTMNVAKFAAGQSAHYPINRIKMRPRTVPTGSQSITLQSIFSGQLPNRLFFGVIPTDRVDGAYDKNPFHFPAMFDKTSATEAQFLTKASIIFNGSRFPAEPYANDYSRPITTSIVNQMMIRPYQDMVDALGMTGTDRGSDLVSPNYWYDNLAIYGVDFNADSGESNNFNPPQRGAMDAELVFKKATTKGYTVLFLGEFENIISIRADRTVYTDFA